ncbi:MAG: hypothetical protein GXN96_02505 [Aquificae bacterium]|nr:hypothetical protein [Aquificota bacterium]
MKPRILFGGLTKAHEILIKASMERLGYEVEPLPVPDNEALRVGKEYCNKGQCNPTYYTVGNLVRYLLEKREKGEKELEDRYVFVTAGACGPCRFGMYEMEYRKALKEAGFPRFRVLTFQQESALLEEMEDLGIRFDRDFFVSLIKSVILGDLLNDIYYKVKPYEVVPGETDRWKEEALSILYDTLREGRSLLKALREVKKKLDSLEVDYFRPKPRVKITGEFFAQTTEGDGNYRLASWLIEEGAEPVVEPVATWVDYLIYEKVLELRERAFKDRLGTIKKIGLLTAFGLYFRGLYNLYRLALGRKPDPLKSQKKLAQYAEPYYNPLLAGGEGHMEVGKHVYVIKHRKAHMVVSVKPFGCMPSTQSDGVQAKVVEDLGGSLFVSVETSGDAETNAKSRILMKLYEAKLRAREEYERTRRELGLSEEDVERLSLRKRKLRSAGTVLPQRYATTAANALLLLK